MALKDSIKTIINKVGDNRLYSHRHVWLIIPLSRSEATHRDHGVIFPDSAKEARSSPGPEGSAGSFRGRQAALGDVHIPSQSHGKWTQFPPSVVDLNVCREVGAKYDNLCWIRKRVFRTRMSPKVGWIFWGAKYASPVVIRCNVNNSLEIQPWKFM